MKRIFPAKVQRLFPTEVMGVIPALSVLLFMQIGLAVALTYSGPDYGSFKSDEKLIPLALEKIDQIEIFGTEDKKLVLKKKDAEWVLPTIDEFPVADGKVDQFLKTLSRLQKGWPVATTAGAAERFKVSEEVFERKLALNSQGENLAELYVGTSPSFRKVHLRLDGSDDIYNVPFSAYEAAVDTEDWEDKGFLGIEEKDIQRVDLPSVNLLRGDGKFSLVDLGDGEEMNMTESENLLRKVASPSYMSVLGKTEKPEFKRSSPAFSYTLSLAEDKTVTYSFSKPGDGDDYVLKVSNQPYFFKVNKYTAEGLRDATREKLVKKKES